MTMLRFIEEGEEYSVEERKRQLRRRMKERRAHNENRDVKELLLVENALAALEGLGVKKGQGNVFCYLSYSSEAPTDLLIEKLQEEGYRVYCPRVEGQTMQAVPYGEDFTLSAFRIREPIGEAFVGEMDGAIVPFLAVDERGNRLGYGGGYYDRYFAKNPHTKKIAYGFDFQVISVVPTVDTDEQMDCIVTDQRVVYTDKK